MTPEISLPASLRDMIHEQVRRNPDAVALFAPGCRPLTYRRLLDQIDMVGRTLRAHGIQRANSVAVVLPNGPDMATAFLGIAAHARCAPLNPSYRGEEIEFYLNDLAAKAVVIPAGVDSPVRGIAAKLGLTVLAAEPSIDAVAGAFRFQSTLPAVEEQADYGEEGDIALILHTSGTTSRPKQVPLSQRNLWTSAHNIAEALALSPGDRCLNVMPLFHIHGLIGVLCSSIYAGGAVVCSAGFDSATFAELLREFQPTWYSAVPTIHQSVLALAAKAPTIAGQAKLRLIRSSSSSLPPTVMAELEATFGVPVIESYGMTEACHQMASNPLPPGQRKPGSVGLPAGPEMAVMDDDGNLLPAGECGEIVIRGANVTSGYVNHPAANEAAFTNGWFRTGDRGRTDEEGYFYITGRTKEMINRGGEKISPREIDEVLLEHPAVGQAVAFAVPHPTLGEDVAAAIVLADGQPVSENELRRFVFNRLAAFKVPSRILTIASIPKGPTGKLQRIGLAKQLEAELRLQFIEPRTELERSVAAAMEEVLNRNSIGAKDNFFFLGGDSLKAARVVAKLSSEFQVELRAVALFLNPTPEELSLEITRLLAEDSGLLEDLLTEVEEMSDEEIRRHLQ